MTDDDFRFVADLLRKRAGLGLTREKLYLLEARLTPMARDKDFPDIEALVRKARDPGAEDLCREIVEAMMVRDTSFFRDRAPFRQLSDIVLPELLKSRAAERRLRIWSAGCSTGQEPYSIAMMLNERAEDLAGWTVSIVATDIAARSIAQAKSGIYSQFEVQRGLPVNLLLRHFTRARSKWRLADPVRAMVSFHEHNLLDGAAQFGQFDIVMCRNVLMPMDEKVRERVFATLADSVADGGYLFLGVGETTAGLADRMQRAHGLYGVYVSLPDDFQLADSA